MIGKRFRDGMTGFGVFGLLVVGLFALASCGGSSSTAGMGSANVTMSDPPSDTTYSHVWVTIDGVEATTSSSDSGWQSLVSDLSSTAGKIKAIQVDLLNLPANGQCLLAQLGSTQSLPAGNYQQIRLMLVANNTPSSDVTLEPYVGESSSDVTNNCAPEWNCAQTSPTSTPVTLNLSSEAQTGLKIPPGQVIGGPIDVAQGKSVDINIDFNADRSIVEEGNGQLRLDPVLLAYEDSGASVNNTGISGQVVSGTLSGTTVTNGNAIPGALVALEYSGASVPDGSLTADLIGNYFVTADSNGNFDFCPLPPDTTFNVVADAGTSSATATTGNYNATVITNVGGGNQITVPLLAESGAAGTISGNVTGSGETANFTADIFALQGATSSLEFTVPLFSGSSPAMAQTSVSCTSSGCTSSPFTLSVPASAPLVGSFSAGNITWQTPVTSVSYNVAATCASPQYGSPTFSGPQTMTSGSITLSSSLKLSGCS